MIQVNENGKVSARELYAALEIKKRFSVWFENILDFFEKEYEVRRSFSYTSNNQKIEYAENVVCLAMQVFSFEEIEYSNTRHTPLFENQAAQKGIAQLVSQ